MSGGLADYLADNYGRCRAQRCICRERQWLGRACPDWIPSGATNWIELRELQRRDYVQSSPKCLAHQTQEL
jgi:hypothetical protein